MLATCTTAGYAPLTVFSDRTKVGLHIRLVLDISNSTGGTLTRGTLNVAVVVRMYCGC